MEFTHSNFLSTRVLGAMERMKYQYSLELHKLGLTPSPDMTDPALNRNSGCEAPGEKKEPLAPIFHVETY